MRDKTVSNSAPITADAATPKTVGVGKSIKVTASSSKDKVTGLSKKEKAIVKVTKKGTKVTIKGKKAGKVTFKIGKKAYTVKVGATSITKKTVTTSMKVGQKKTLSVNAVNGKGDTIQFTSSKKSVVKVNKASAKATAKKVASTTVTAVKAGTAKITAKSKYTGKSKTFTLKVTAATVTPTPAVTTNAAVASTPAATATVTNAPSNPSGDATKAPTPTTGAATTAPTETPEVTSGASTATPEVTSSAATQAPTDPDKTNAPGTTDDANKTPAPGETETPSVTTGGTITVTGTAVTTDAAVKVVSGTTVVYEGTVAGLTAKKLDAGTYVVTVSKKGYEDATTSAVVVDKENTTVTVELVESATVVSEVYDVTTATVSVEMKVAAETTPSADTFKVLVNGTTNAVKTVTKVAGDTTNTKFVLTLTDSLNKKEGTLTVNGTAAKKAGSDFDFDFKAPTAVATAVNATTVDVTFSEKVSKAEAETTTNYNIAKVSDKTSTSAVNSAVLQADGKTVRLNLATPLTMANYVLTLNPTAGAGTQTLQDLADNALANDSEAVFAGTADADTTAPELVSVSYDESAGKIYFNFNEAVSNTFVQTGVTITDGTTSVKLSANDTAAASNGQIVVTLGATNKAALKTLGTNKTVSIAADTVKDVALNGIAVVTNFAVAEKTVLKSASYDEATNYLTLTFSNPVNVKSLDLTKIKLTSTGASDVTLDSNDTVKTTENGTVVQIELKKDSALDNFEGSSVTKRAVTLIAANFADINNVAVAGVSDLALTYEEDTVAPVVESVSYNATTQRVTITFTEPVQVQQATSTWKIGTVNFTDKETSGFTTDDTTCDQIVGNTGTVSSKTVSFHDGTASHGLKSTSKLYFAKGTFKDDAGNEIAEVKQADGIAISYIDQSGPVISSLATEGKDAIVVTFNKAVSKETAENIANYTVAMDANENVKIDVTDAKLYANGTKVRLALAASQTNGILYRVTANNILDTKGNAIQIGSAKNYTTVSGVDTKDSSALALAGTDIAFDDVDNSKSVTAGDKITLTFNKVLDIDFTKIKEEDFTIGGGKTFGTGASFAYGDSRDQIVVTLGNAGTSSVVLGTTTIAPASGSDIKDMSGNVAGTANLTLVDKGDAPKLTKAVYADTNADGVVSQGDKITLTYSENLKLGTVTTADFTFGSSETFGTADVTYALGDSNQIIVTLGSDMAANTPIVGTTTINSKATGNITDTWGKQQAAASQAIKLTSEDTTAPTITGAKIKKATANTDNTKLEENDTVEITFSEAIHLGAGKAAADFILYSGNTAINDCDSTNIAVSADKKSVVITLTTGCAWINKKIADITTFNLKAGQTSVYDASENAATISAGFGVTVTK